QDQEARQGGVIARPFSGDASSERLRDRSEEAAYSRCEYELYETYATSRSVVAASRLRFAAGLYPRRAAGGHCYYRRAGGAAAASRAGGARGSQAVEVHLQHQAIGARLHHVSRCEADVSASLHLLRGGA